MAFRAWDRTGTISFHGDDANIPAVLDHLLRELEAESHDGRTAVSVGWGEWNLEAWESGLLSLEDRSRVAGSQCDQEFEVRRWAADRDEVARIMALVAAGHVKEALALPGWVGLYDEPLPPQPQPAFFRRRPDAAPGAGAT